MFQYFTDVSVLTFSLMWRWIRGQNEALIRLQCFNSFTSQIEHITCNFMFKPNICVYSFILMLRLLFWGYHFRTEKATKSADGNKTLAHTPTFQPDFHCNGNSFTLVTSPMMPQYFSTTSLFCDKTWKLSCTFDRNINQNQ